MEGVRHENPKEKEIDKNLTIYTQLHTNRHAEKIKKKRKHVSLTQKLIELS